MRLRKKNGTTVSMSRASIGPPKVMTAAEVAKFLRVDIKTVYAEVNAGQLPGRRVGRRVVFLREALLDWLRSNERVLPPKRGK